MKLKLLITSLLAVILLAGCGTTTAADEIPATLSVSGSGIASTDPDVVDIQLGVDTIDPDLAEAVDQNTNKMNAMMSLLTDMGIDEKDIQTTNYNLWVEDVYDQNGQPTSDKRYHVSNMVSVRLRDLNQIGDLIEQATSAGATNVSGINFSVADTTQLQQAALDNALDNAQEKAEWMASKMGKTLGKMKNVTEGGYYSQPMPVAEVGLGIGGAGAVPISQGQFTMSAQVQVVFELLP
ncbi:MAG: SIMPL domain-containing protein [Chloroflexota bacterium]|nr:MAG: SIMPL domain-containing protein [Chloroflexota bacterium]